MTDPLHRFAYLLTDFQRTCTSGNPHTRQQLADALWNDRRLAEMDREGLRAENARLRTELEDINREVRTAL